MLALFRSFLFAARMIPVLAILQNGLLAQDSRLVVKFEEAGNEIRIFRSGSEEPILTHVAREDFRPYIHPIAAPRGSGVMTEFSPEHHPHQTGLFWGFTRLNGRDYFHHPDSAYWRRVSATILKAESLAVGSAANDPVQWQTVYDLLDESGNPILRESQIWSMRDEGDCFVLDLQWTGQALEDVVIGQSDYGGLFLRMPWRNGIAGQVVNSARLEGRKAEGQRSIWIDVGMQLDSDQAQQAHFAIFDHPLNGGYPQAWRVDDSFGVGPARARFADWQIVKGQQETIRHRLIAYVGEKSNAELMRRWSEYSGVDGDYIMWHLAQQAGRQAEFLTPEKAVESMTLQDGFQANVFAAEPMISQPMAFCWDAKGRLWVAENRDYETRQTGFSSDGSSRVLILEDSDRDGVAESRKVFLEGVPFPAAMAVGMGGLWLGAPPNLLFVPDRDADDRADLDKIEVRLTGWGIADRHETLNSLIWGPDGWLYGLQGFATPSNVGKPAGEGKVYKHGEPFPEDVQYDGETTQINGGVWRYHPTKKRFEVVAHGFSNPWGIDYDACGQLFITACVIPHLWHVIPGGIYHRQGGQHFNPYLYSDITTIADHRHQSAHGGARIYQSDAFPEEYQGRIFMANIHEHAVLSDILTPKGSGFVGSHGDDFALANNAQWVGFSVEVGPDGAVYVLDWHDADICGKEVINKETGRIFRFAPEVTKAEEFPNRYSDLNSLDDLALAKLQWVPSAWHARHARIILQYRSQDAEISQAALGELQSVLQSDRSQSLRLRALWTLHGIGALDAAALEKLLQDTQPYVRAWAIQFLTEDLPSEALAQRLIELVRDESSAVVRLYLASAVQRLDERHKWPMIEDLTLRAEDNDDHNIPKMIWFGLEPLVGKDFDRALKLAQQSKLDLVSRFIARRMGDHGEYQKLLTGIARDSGNSQVQMLLGLRDSLDGRFDVPPPDSWREVYQTLETQGGPASELAKQISNQFTDNLVSSHLVSLLSDPKASDEDRRNAIGRLAGQKYADLANWLIRLLDDDAESVRLEAIRAVAAYDDIRLARKLLELYPKLSSAQKQEVVQSLASRSSHGHELTGAIADGRIPKGDIPAHVARLLRRVVGNRFVDVWGPIDELSADKEALFSKYRTLATEQALGKADLKHGQEIFMKTCASCHQLHGVGGKIGPDITGANRSNLEYLLSNILTPSSVIQDAYRMHIILTDDGRIYSGIPSEETDRYLRLLVADSQEPISIPQSEIESREIASVSLMPDGLLANLTDTDAIDLIAYLQSKQQLSQQAK